MSSGFLLRGLYIITDGPDPTSRVDQALAGGARLVQYRDKTNDQARRRREALDLRTLCRAYSVPLIINDDLDLAAELGANGVHLGRSDPAPEEARRVLGPEAIIGISCYNELERAIAAAEAGADYLAFGRFFPSGTKPLAVQAYPELLRQARQTLDLPLVAIGGITPENGGALIEAGADMLAVVGGVFGQADVQGAARAFTRLFDKGGVT
jgi:thiamine-phosphate pyrophosphorylase